MTNVLKKIQVGNPLINLGLMKLYDEYQSTKNDEELASFYHRALTICEGSQIATSLLFAMMSYSTGIDFNPYILIPDED